MLSAALWRRCSEERWDCGRDAAEETGRQQRDSGASHQLLPGPLSGHTPGPELLILTEIKHLCWCLSSLNIKHPFLMFVNEILKRNRTHYFHMFWEGNCLSLQFSFLVGCPHQIGCPQSGLWYKQATNTNTEHLNGGQLALSVMRMSVYGGHST